MHYDTKEEIRYAAEEDTLLYYVLQFGRMHDLTYQETLESAVLALSKANKFHRDTLVKMTNLTIEPLVIGRPKDAV